MIICREDLIQRLSEISGYYKKDIKTVLQSLDEVIIDCFSEVTDDEEVVIQIAKGIRCGVKVMPERQRKDPRSQDDIICPPCCKPFTRFSDDFRKNIQKKYEEKKDD